MEKRKLELFLKVNLDTTDAQEKIKELINMLEHANQLKTQLDN